MHFVSAAVRFERRGVALASPHLHKVEARLNAPVDLNHQCILFKQKRMYCYQKNVSEIFIKLMSTMLQPQQFNISSLGFTGLSSQCLLALKKKKNKNLVIYWMVAVQLARLDRQNSTTHRKQKFLQQCTAVHLILKTLKFKQCFLCCTVYVSA